MALRIECSGCQCKLSVPEELQGKQIKCPKCSHVNSVPKETGKGSSSAMTAAKTQPNKSSDSIAKGPPPLPSKSAKKNRDDDKAKARRALQDDDDDDEDDDEDEDSEDQPKRKKAKAKSSMPLILGIAGAALVVVAVVVVIMLNSGGGGSKGAAQAKPPAAVNKPDVVAAGENPPEAAPMVAPEGENPPEENPETKPIGREVVKQVEAPTGPAPAAIDPQVTGKVKKATAYLRVRFGNGLQATGSGFFAAEKGLVFTNAHVLGMLNPASSLPTNVEVIVNSGIASKEYALKGIVLGVDRENDLGVLRVEGDAKGLPDPLPLDTAGNLSELQKVYIFGFPFGESLGKDITVSESSVSSLRREKDGSLGRIQVNGGMNPGNSGGPVVDGRGVVIGVAVAGIQGTQINFAVPGEKLQGLLRGRIYEINFGEPYLNDTKAKLPVHLVCLDPMRRLKTVKLEYWKGSQGPGRPPSWKKPEPEAGDGDRKTLNLTYKDSKASIELDMPEVAEGEAFWIQPVLTDNTGLTHWAPGVSYKVSEYPPLERKPANLTLDYEKQAERTLKLISSHKLQFSKGKKQFTIGENLEVDALELSKKDPAGILFQLHLGETKLSQQQNDKAVEMNSEAQALLKGQFINFISSDVGILNTRGSPNLSPSVSPKIRENFNEMIVQIANSYEMTCLTYPNRELKPKETWQAKVPMLVGNRLKEVVDMHLTCTFEGTRQYMGETQAMVALNGNIQSRKPGKATIGGKVTGKAHFAIDKGYIGEAKLRIETELGDDDLNVAAIVEISLTRVPGNTHGIIPAKMPDPPPNVAKGKAILQTTAILQEGDMNNYPDRMGCFYKALPMKLQAGKTYIIEMGRIGNQGDVDPYLILHDTQNKKVAENDDDGPMSLNSRIVYKAPSTGAYQIIVTTLMPGQMGPFTFAVYEAVAPPANNPANTPKKDKGAPTKKG